MYKLYFESLELANNFIDEVNQLGCEWHPLRAYANGPFTGYCLEFEASQRETDKVNAYYLNHGTDYLMKW